MSSKYVQGVATFTVGDRVTLNCGVEVVVIAFGNAKVTVADSDGVTKVVPASQLRSGSVSWTTKEGKKLRKKREHKKLAPGDRFESQHHGWCVVESVGTPKGKMVVRFEETGATSTVYTHTFFSGKLRDPSVPKLCAVERYYPVGSRYESKRHGWYEVISTASSKEVTVRWDDTGHVQTGIQTTQIRAGSVRDESIPEGNYLKPSGHYVYVAEANGDVVYVGKGNGKRYLHCDSGCSSNYDLNRLHHTGVPISVRIYRDGMDNETALDLERQLILELQPAFNKVLPVAYEFDLDALPA